MPHGPLLPSLRVPLRSLLVLQLEFLANRLRQFLGGIVTNSTRAMVVVPKGKQDALRWTAEMRPAFIE
jgi:hypothetical protein